ncbi:hypothetical protein NIES2111_25970 [Nostoc sp. NIES-2111]|nr:hypothetical protein NIES2111_25970 [Nostoc sp. NIES-2111]
MNRNQRRQNSSVKLALFLSRTCLILVSSLFFALKISLQVSLAQPQPSQPDKPSSETSTPSGTSTPQPSQPDKPSSETSTPSGTSTPQPSQLDKPSSETM